jgi:DNA-3-methyladenine glycosylase II
LSRPFHSIKQGFSLINIHSHNKLNANNIIAGFSNCKRLVVSNPNKTYPSKNPQNRKIQMPFQPWHPFNGKMNDAYAVDFLTQKDSKLASLIKKIGSYTIDAHKDPFESLLKSIIYQQLSGRSANAIYRRFLNHYDDILPTPEQIISTPKDIFRAKIGLSFKKIEYIKDLSSRVFSGELRLSLLPGMTDEEIVAELVKVKGIGRWTAEMFLIFHLRRKDVMPLGDLGIRKAVQKLYGLQQLPSTQHVLKISMCWKPYRSIAAWYLWKSLASFESI